MKLSAKRTVVVLFLFIALYSVYIFLLNVEFSGYNDIIVASTFFFALFTGFFITRQNDRYSAVSLLITETDGHFSFLYRISGVIPRLQDELREIIRNHYQKILDSGDWAYHIHNPSNTITRVTKAFTSITEEEKSDPMMVPVMTQAMGAISDLQIKRKHMVSVLSEGLITLHWAIIFSLAFIVIVSFGFIPAGTIAFQFLKVLFGTSVFISILLLVQLDHLTIFGDNAAENTARDIFNIIDEKDAEALGTDIE